MCICGRTTEKIKKVFLRFTSFLSLFAHFRRELLCHRRFWWKNEKKKTARRLNTS